MRKLNKGIRTALLLSCVGLSLLGNEASAAPYVITGQLITRMSTGWGAEGLYIETSGAPQAGSACGANNNFLIEAGGGMNKEMTSLLMIAMQNDFPVDMYVDGCVNGAIKLKAIYVNKRR